MLELTQRHHRGRIAESIVKSLSSFVLYNPLGMKLSDAEVKPVIEFSKTLFFNGGNRCEADAADIANRVFRVSNPVTTLSMPVNEALLLLGEEEFRDIFMAAVLDTTTVVTHCKPKLTIKEFIEQTIRGEGHLVSAATIQASLCILGFNLDDFTRACSKSVHDLEEGLELFENRSDMTSHISMTKIRSAIDRLNALSEFVKGYDAFYQEEEVDIKK